MPGASTQNRDQSGTAPPHRFRTIFVSDLHLGARASQANAFLDFLRHHEANTIYLVGDIIDFWSLKRSPVWLQSHNDVLQKLLRKARKGTKIIFIPGNHDDALRGYCDMHFGTIEIRRDVLHEAADGSRCLVMHGDEFDVILRYAKWLAFLGDRSYEFLLWCNRPLNFVRRRLGFGYWSLAAYLKLRVKSAVNFIGEFEVAIAAEAKKRGANGVICGHIHHMADRSIDGIRYVNCGDWVESCTAIAEDFDGRLHQIRWPGEASNRERAEPERIRVLALQGPSEEETVADAFVPIWAAAGTPLVQPAGKLHEQQRSASTPYPREIP